MKKENNVVSYFPGYAGWSSKYTAILNIQGRIYLNPTPSSVMRLRKLLYRIAKDKYYSIAQNSSVWEL